MKSKLPELLQYLIICTAIAYCCTCVTDCASRESVIMDNYQQRYDNKVRQQIKAEQALQLEIAPLVNPPVLEPPHRQGFTF